MNVNSPARILIADDDPEDMELMEEAILEIAPDTELFKFSNGRMVTEYLEKTTPETLPGAVVLDYNMPELTGAEVLLYMQKQERLQHIPKIVLSTSNSSQHIRECVANGAHEYIVKPDNIRELSTLAQKIMNYCTGR